MRSLLIRTYYLIRYAYIFLKALVIANIDVAKLVMSQTVKVRPGFLAVPMEAVTDLEITSLANSITLTPGTISVHIARDHKTIIVHVLHVGDDPEPVRRDIKQTLEANILKWTRPILKGASR